MSGLEVNQPLDTAKKLVCHYLCGVYQTYDNSDPEAIRHMLRPICQDITEGQSYNGYLVYQGGVPEVKEFIKSFRK